MLAHTSLPAHCNSLPLARTSRSRAVRWRYVAGAAVALTLLVGFMAGPAAAQTLVTPVSFEDRFTAVAAAEQTAEAAPATPGSVSRPDDPPKLGAPLKRAE